MLPILLQDRCWEQLIDYITTPPNDLIHVQRYNGCDSLHIAGQHNHRAEYVIELFQWIADNAIGSYGILYIRDDKDQKRISDYSNSFRIWRLCRGLFETPIAA